MSSGFPSWIAPEAPSIKIQPLPTGQKALVTEASSGIGRGVAIALVQAGADIVVNHTAGDEAAMARVESIGLRGAHDALRRWWDDGLHRVCHRRLGLTPGA